MHRQFIQPCPGGLMQALGNNFCGCLGNPFRFAVSMDKNNSRCRNSFLTKIVEIYLLCFFLPSSKWKRYCFSFFFYLNCFIFLKKGVVFIPYFQYLVQYVNTDPLCLLLWIYEWPSTKGLKLFHNRCSRHAFHYCPWHTEASSLLDKPEIKRRPELVFCLH